MEALIWGEKFLTGLPTVDRQHHRLVELINAFGELASRHAEVPRAQLEAVVDELGRYAHSHFHDEEVLMEEAGVDSRYAGPHRAQHGRFLRDVVQMRAANFLEAPETTRVLLRFLLHWLAFHILGIDMQLARQMERLRRGESAEAAYEAEVREVEGPAGLLLGALDDLMRVVAQRNAELLEANRTLEARVTERTAQLSATVDRLRATQVKLVETEKLATVGQLASGLAHEINNPLAYINANLGSLADHARALLEVVDVAATLEPALPEAARATLQAARSRADVAFVRDDLDHLLGETREGVRRVQGIVQDLKTFSHVDGGALLDLDLRTCVETTLKVLPPHRREGVPLATRFLPAPRVRCQAAQVSQAVLELVLNATQAVRDRGDGQGEVTVRTGPDGEGAYVEVMDSGVGMAPEVLTHVFEPFFTTRPPGQGTGLGLTTAYNCAQAHGGRLEASSDPGVGSTFRLWLPAQPPLDRARSGPLTNAFNTRRYPGTGLPG